MSDMVDILKQRLRLIPLLVVVASLAFVVRIGDAALQFRDLSGSANAQETADTKKTEEPEAGKEAAPAKEGEEKPATTVATKPAAKPAPPTDWSDASEGDIDYSTLRKELYEDLQQRRQQLDQKERDLDQREALLEAGEKEINRKYEELTGLRNEIQDLLKKQSDEEDARIASLVKIYEGMKPKDAARIFNTLDMDIMIDVVGRMSERKSAPIIASMEADRARALTTLLAEQKKLPELPEDAGAPPAQN